VIGVATILGVGGTLIADYVLQWSQLPPPPLTGTRAVDFTLPDVQSGDPVSLKSFRGRPLVLILGSFDCNVFCEEASKVEQLHRAYKSRVQFLFVQVATPPGHAVQPLDPLPADSERATDERLGRARAVVRVLHLSMPCVLDGEDQAVQQAYDARPKRMVLLDAKGTIVADSGQGVPYGWGLPAFEEELKTLLQGGGRMQ
jgi:hypothetical protein